MTKAMLRSGQMSAKRRKHPLQNRGGNACRRDVTGPYRPLTGRADAAAQLHETGHSCILQHPSRSEGQEGGTKQKFALSFQMPAYVHFLDILWLQSSETVKAKYMRSISFMCRSYMCRLLLMFAFVLALAEPEAADADEVLARIDRNTVVTDASRDDGFSRGEQIWVDTSGIVRPSLHRVGTLHNARYGYKYGSDRSVFVDPNNPVESVFVNCRRDRISGRNSCFMDVGFSNLKITIAPNGRAAAACVMGHDFPGRAAAIRVEGYQIIRTNENGCVGSNTAATLLKQLSSGQTLHVQRVEWPYDVGETTTMQINDKVSVALQIWKFTNGGRFSAKLFRADTSSAHRQDIVRRNGM